MNPTLSCKSLDFSGVTEICVGISKVRIYLAKKPRRPTEVNPCVSKGIFI